MSRGENGCSDTLSDWHVIGDDCGGFAESVEQGFRHLRPGSVPLRGVGAQGKSAHAWAWPVRFTLGAFRAGHVPASGVQAS